MRVWVRVTLSYTRTFVAIFHVLRPVKCMETTVHTGNATVPEGVLAVKAARIVNLRDLLWLLLRA